MLWAAGHTILVLSIIILLCVQVRAPGHQIKAQTGILYFMPLEQASIGAFYFYENVLSLSRLAFQVGMEQFRCIVGLPPTF